LIANLKSINYWSHPGGLDGTLDIGVFLRTAKAQGYEAVELCIGDSGVLNLETTESQCQSILRDAEEVGIQVASVASGTYWGYAIGDEDSAKSAHAVQALRSMIKITSWLKCSTLLTIIGAVDVFFLPDRAPQSYDLVLERARQGLNEILPTAEDHGVVLALENVWNKLLLSPTEMAAFIDSFSSKSLGAYFDVGNILPYGYPEQWLRILGGRVAGIHFKDFRRAVGTAEGFVDLLEGDVNWPEVMLAIQEIGFKGPLVAELIPLYKHYPLVRAANTSRSMDAIMGRE
jgi:L-ribulose-5-phosphate 3-epimerase